MMISKKTRVLLALFLGLLCQPLPSHAVGIWEIANKAIQRDQDHVVQLTFDEIKRTLPLLTAATNYTITVDHIVIANRIEITPTTLRSYTNPITEPREIPEFEITYGEASSWNDLPFAAVATLTDTPRSTSLEGIKIALDVIPAHPLFTDPIGGLAYADFVKHLQTKLNEELSARGASVSILRPRHAAINATIADNINLSTEGETTPDWVISPQFNADKTPLMTSFCGGNTLTTEFAVDRQRARFVHALLTGKSSRSVALGGCISEACEKSTALGAQHAEDGTLTPAVQFCEEERTFEGNAAPISDRFGPYAQAVKTRNLLHHGFMVQAVVIPFPDMFWVQEKVAQLGLDAFVQGYVTAIADGACAFRSKY